MAGIATSCVELKFCSTCPDKVLNDIHNPQTTRIFTRILLLHLKLKFRCYLLSKKNHASGILKYHEALWHCNLMPQNSRDCSMVSILERREKNDFCMDVFDQPCTLLLLAIEVDPRECMRAGV